MEMEMKMLGRWKRRGDEELECVVRKREREVWTDDRFGHITHAGRTAVGMG